MGAMDK